MFRAISQQIHATLFMAEDLFASEISFDRVEHTGSY